MPKRDFLDNIRVARNLFVHPQVFTDSKHLDPQTMTHTLARAAIWLTPASVKGFRVQDFVELSTENQQELSEAVQDFLRIATRVPPTAPASDADYTAGAEAMTRMLGILAPYLPTRDEALKVREALQTIQFPSYVVNWDYELASDADGAPALRVTVFADDRTLPPRESGRLILELTTRLRQALTAIGINRWPYIIVRTVAEHMAR